MGIRRMYQFSGMNVVEAGLKEGLDVPTAVKRPGDLDTEVGGPVKDDVVPDRRTTKFVSQFWAGATHERVCRQQVELGRARPELTAELRSSRQANYIILYRPTDFGVEIARVLHGSRDIESLF